MTGRMGRAGQRASRGEPGGRAPGSRWSPRVRVTPASVTVSDPDRVGILALVGLVCAVPASVILASLLVRRGSAALAATVVAASAAALVVGWVRVLRKGLRMDRDGVTVRYLWRTYRYGWSEVSHLGDGSAAVLSDGPPDRVWALAVVLRDESARVVRAGGFPTGADLRQIRQAAGRYALRTELTGTPATPRTAHQGRAARDWGRPWPRPALWLAALASLACGCLSLDLAAGDRAAGTLHGSGTMRPLGPRSWRLPWPWSSGVNTRSSATSTRRARNPGPAGPNSN